MLDVTTESGPPAPHSRAWYAEQARTRGGYLHPWARELDGPDPEGLFDTLLDNLLTPETRVLEAGCGHGPDAARFGARVARWTGYDRQPELLDLARVRAPQAEFVPWDGKSTPPLEFDLPFDLIVSRRGPTSVVPHLPALAAPGAHYLYVGPGWDVPRHRERLQAVGWATLFEAHTRTRAWLPTEADYALMCEFNNLEADPAHWQAGATPRGLAYVEERVTVLAVAG